MTIPVLTVQTVPGYLAERPNLAALVDLATIEVKEIGDGNLNLVFVVTDAAGRGLVLKQSLPYVRLVGESWPLSQDRILAEARGYDAAVALTPETIPDYHGLDYENRVIALEDLSSWTVWRSALNEGRISRGAAAFVARHVARVGFGTSAFALESDAVKLAAAGAINVDLCKITEDLVFTQPYIDHPDNSWHEELTADVLALRDGGLVDEIAALKHRFVTHAEALLHGDLHTGSIFVPAGDSTVPAKVFDLEFGFYGPVAFDLGALFGNVLLAQARATALDRPAEFQQWLAGLVAEAWTAFEEQFRALWPTRIDASYTDAFLNAWLRQTWADAIGFGGAKAIRRIVGLAKASDIESLEPVEHVQAARQVLTTARAWIQSRASVADPVALAALTADSLVRV
jgi:5-methylthioribose kinase